MIAVLCYDLCDAKRLKKMHKLASQYGVALQLSVFLIQLNPDKLAELTSSIEELIDVEEDEVKIYPIKHLPKDYLEQIGVKLLTEGVVIS